MSQWRNGVLDHLVPSRLIEVIEFSKPVIILISYSPPPFKLLIHSFEYDSRKGGELCMLLMLKFNSPFPPSSALSLLSFQISFRQAKKKKKTSLRLYKPMVSDHVTSKKWTVRMTPCFIMARTLGWTSRGLALTLVFAFIMPWILGKSLGLSVPGFVISKWVRWD